MAPWAAQNAEIGRVIALTTGDVFLTVNKHRLMAVMVARKLSPRVAIQHNSLDWYGLVKWSLSVVCCDKFAKHSHSY